MLCPDISSFVHTSGLPSDEIAASYVVRPSAQNHAKSYSNRVRALPFYGTRKILKTNR
jgi:hypothetical protein